MFWLQQESVYGLPKEKGQVPVLRQQDTFQAQKREYKNQSKIIQFYLRY